MSFSGCGGKKSFPSTSAGDFRELPRVSLRVDGYCGVGGASRDSAGFVTMVEGLISRGGRNLRLPVSDSDIRVPAELGQESQATSFLRSGTPLASRVVHGVSGPLSNCVWNLQVFPDDARGCQ